MTKIVVEFLRKQFVGKTIRIINMKGEPEYEGRIGIVKHVDDIGQLHGTWGSLAIDFNEDLFALT